MRNQGMSSRGWIRSGMALAGLACAAATLGAAPAEEGRIRGIEERLARVERALERLVEMLEASSGAEEAGPVASGLREAAGAIRRELEEVSASAAQETGVTATVVDRGGMDASEEIVNVPYSGYMEMHLNHDNISPTTLDFHRFVLLFGHGFGERIRFWSELELEHAFVEGGEASGELELEQAYLDFLIHPRLNFRAGMLLTPLGIINERHEPPAFNGVERPFVDTFIVPTTWFGGGAGLVGDLGKGFSYRSYLMSSLNARGFSAEEGFREGRQKGFLENARNMAWTGRLEYRGLPGLTLGTSFWTGETGWDFRDLNGRASIFEFDGRFRSGRLEGRGQFAITHLGEADQINTLVRRRVGVNPNIAEKMRGFYLEGGYSLLPPRLSHELVGFYRYENFDTQFRMPEGFLPLPQFDRSAHVLGLTYFPYPDVALKFDYNFLNNRSQVVEAFDRWNFGIGWWF